MIAFRVQVYAAPPRSPPPMTTPIPPLRLYNLTYLLYSGPPDGGTPPVTSEFPQSLPNYQYRKLALSEPPPYTSLPVPIPSLPSFSTHLPPSTTTAAPSSNFRTEPPSRCSNNVYSVVLNQSTSNVFKIFPLLVELDEIDEHIQQKYFSDRVINYTIYHNKSNFLCLN